MRIRLLENGNLKFKSGREETPRNKVLKIEDNTIFFALNKDPKTKQYKHTGKVNINTYCRLALWARKMTFDHKDITKGVIAYNDGIEHKSLGAAIMNTPKNKKVFYANFDRTDCRDDNLKTAYNDHLYDYEDN